MIKNNFHHLEVGVALKELSSEIAGLSAEEVKRRAEKYGPNEISEKKGSETLKLVLKQFNSPFIYILIIAAIISLVAGKAISFYVIMAVVFINATIGFIQEFKAEKTIEALKKLIVSTTKVFRDGELTEIETKELVPGDIIFLEEGDKIPADARIIESKNFRTQESSLTGESYPVDKSIKILPTKTPVSDRKNMVWMGTFAVYGEAKAVVTATGKFTFLGQIANSIEDIKRNKWHFEEKITKLSKQLGLIAFLATLTIFLTGFFFRGFEFTKILLFSMVSLVASIPEGLPAVVTIVLAIGASRMAKKNAVTRTLPGIETLSVINTIITDKTGTLTQNTINVEKIIVPQEKEITVTGEGWRPHGNFYQNKIPIVPLDNPRVSKLLHIASLCNNARVIKEEDESSGEYKIIGDPTEAAALVLAQRGGLAEDIISETQIKIDDTPFNSDRKYRASLIDFKTEESRKELFIVGAPEVIIKNCLLSFDGKEGAKFDIDQKRKMLKEVERLANQGLRTIAFAIKKVPQKSTEIQEDSIKELTFVGIIGMKDPLRPEVIDAIKKAKKAGIRVLMATGDHKNTAVSIAKEIGLIGLKESILKKALTEEELNKLTPKEFDHAVKNVSVFARLSPQMKLKIAESLQKSGAVVAMTGDGVNDAAALKKADIGISMGIVGSDVARESSEIVLADDNFASIISAVEEGRVVFNNTRRATSFLITTTVAGNTTILSTLFLGMPLPFLPLHVLWVNLVTDTVAGVALATEPSHKVVLNMPPRKKSESILSRELVPFIIAMAAVMAILTVCAFYLSLSMGHEIEKARTVSFGVLALTQLFNMLNLRSLSDSIFKLGLFSNKNTIIGFFVSIALILFVIYIPFLQGVFEFRPLSLLELAVIFAISTLVLFAGELYKAVARRKEIKY